MLCALHVEVVAAVEIAVADGFHDVVLADGDAAFQIGYCSRYFQDSVVGPRAHVHLGDGLAEFFHSFGVGFGVFVEQGGGHLSVAVHAWVVLEAEALDGARFYYPFPNCCTGFSWCFARHLLEVHRLNFHLQVNSIQQRSRDFAHIIVPLMRRADALLRWVSVVTARARIHRSHEHK